MLYQIMDHIKDIHPAANCIYLNMELHEFSGIKNHDDLLQYVKSKSTNGDDRVFIDEIQDIEYFERALRSLAAEGRYDIYCTGSNADMLSGELATHLAGRAVEFRIYGLTYDEFFYFMIFLILMKRLRNISDTADCRISVILSSLMRSCLII